MKINAYVLASDPGTLEASVLSYYDMVTRIIVSYDENDMGWTGAPTPFVGECLGRLRAIDRDKKMVYLPGHFARTEETAVNNETYQRQVAMEEANEGADWVIQTDIDEVIGSPRTFVDCLQEATRAGCEAMNYPATWIYTHARGPWYLARCRRGFRVVTDFPAPMVLRAGSRHALCRRIDANAKIFHIDINRKPNYLAWPPNIPVDRIIRRADGIYHFSWVRSRTFMEAKLASWAHSAGRDWSGELRRWDNANRYPWTSAVLSQFMKSSPFYSWPTAPVKVPAPVYELMKQCPPETFGAKENARLTVAVKSQEKLELV